MHFKTADIHDFDKAFYFIQKLWDYNTYDKQDTLKVYEQILCDPSSFAFFLIKDDVYCGFCHGVIFDTFWMSGPTCYLSSLILDEPMRRKGYGTKILQNVINIARAEECKCIILDSGIPRTSAHKFYEDFGFEKSCYGFELFLHS